MQIYLQQEETTLIIRVTMNVNHSFAGSRTASCQLLAKEWTLNTDKLPPGGLPSKRVVEYM